MQLKTAVCMTFYWAPGVKVLTYSNSPMFYSEQENPTNIYLLKVNKRNTRKMCEICSNITIKAPERRLVFLLLTLNIFHTFF